MRRPCAGRAQRARTAHDSGRTYADSDPTVQFVRHFPSLPGVPWSPRLFHVRARRTDLCFELSRLIVERLGAAATVVDEVHGFRYFEARDLLGFVDGSESPRGAAAAEAVFVGDEDAQFRGGSHVIVQKYLHDLAAWQSLTVEQQERAVGRTKSTNVELPDDIKPADSHVALNTIVDDDGAERKIVRENMPFGTIGRGEFGTYFIGYARTPEVTERMLANMFLGDPPGNTDRILDFSTAVTGGLFFVPSTDLLDSPPAPPTGAACSAAVPRGGSLGIGGMRGAPAP
ncbi:Dyp-type peroxidase [Streptomyces noursei]|uniref:Dyp-type peroxidase n=1 Tax=Streptomyces noursei TaxID=1971 RepID=UPI00081C6220|nr:dyp-type peroxidase [Streptomyces noursei ATCC 11455]MCZ0992082.1 Dyp-type peroxidase [Streptomyces noursei]